MLRWCASGVAVLMMCLCGAAAAQAGAMLLLPTAIAYDDSGNLYIADANRHQVIEATVGGTLLVVAGTGVQGFAGDGGAANAAQLDSPQGLAWAADGTLYIADTGNSRVRAIKNGTIVTFAGTGIAGYVGDGALATLAALNRPTALAVVNSVLYIADTNNHRVRAVNGGTISTVVGTGAQGFAGDGGAAVLAMLDSPQGLVGNGSSLLIADTRNNRVRVVDGAGTISTLMDSLLSPRGLGLTSDAKILVADANRNRVIAIDGAGAVAMIAGTATQGVSAETSAAANAELNVPRAAMVDAYGDVAIADTGNARVVVLWNDGLLHVPAAFAPGRRSALAVSGTSSVIYGMGAAQVSVQGLGVAQGAVQMSEGQQAVAQTALVSGGGTISLAALPAGSHALQVSYTGDGVNPSATQALAWVVTQAPAMAVPAAVAVAYGQAVPVLAGTVSGVLPQDAAFVTAVFSSAATPLAPPGVYPITAVLTGSASGNYSLTTQPGAVTITRAGTTTVAATPQMAYSGLPMLLSATVAAAFQGTPTGAVVFLESGNVLTMANLSGGIATATWTGAAAGNHSIVAQYAGDANFLGSTSSLVSAVVTAVPDFLLSATNTSQQVQGGTVATYPFTVTAQPGPFNGAVSLSVTGLPTGATATFAPVQVVPGSGSAAVTLSILTPIRAVRGVERRAYWFALVIMIGLATRKRRRSFAALLCGFGMLGCGDRVAPDTALQTASYTLQVTGTGTNVMGTVVSRSMNITLGIR